LAAFVVAATTGGTEVARITDAPEKGGAEHPPGLFDTL